MPGATIEDLQSVIALKELPDEHLQWILDHSEYREYEDGQIIGKYGEPADVMWLSWTGKVVFYMEVNGRQVYYFTFENNNVTGGVGGLMPYSRMKTYPGYSYASGLVKTVMIHRDQFGALEALNPSFIQKLIGYMTERARAFATTQLQYEKVNALGNLAAGIAHEMNNPAAAIQGISDELGKRLQKNYELTRNLLDCNIKKEQLQLVQQLVEQKENGPRPKMSALQCMEQQDELEEWLEANGIADRAMAETFSESGYTVAEMEATRTGAGQDCFVQLIPWLENLINSRKLIKDLANASGRISSLVSSIKSHVHMDRTNDMQPTNIHQDLENTLTLLGFKIREKNIAVKKCFASGMPELPAFVGELNQVWTNLIDNAIFALPKNGQITVETSFDSKNVQVRLIDNGPGIPAENQSRIFEPFFTTKKMGEGTGIGLDLVNRIVKKHNGTISVESVPGKTEFKVSIPLANLPVVN